MVSCYYALILVTQSDHAIRQALANVENSTRKDMQHHPLPDLGATDDTG